MVGEHPLLAAAAYTVWAPLLDLGGLHDQQGATERSVKHHQPADSCSSSLSLWKKIHIWTSESTYYHHHDHNYHYCYHCSSLASAAWRFLVSEDKKSRFHPAARWLNSSGLLVSWPPEFRSVSRGQRSNIEKWIDWVRYIIVRTPPPSTGRCLVPPPGRCLVPPSAPPPFHPPPPRWRAAGTFPERSR